MLRVRLLGNRRLLVVMFHGKQQLYLDSGCVTVGTPRPHVVQGSTIHTCRELSCSSLPNWDPLESFIFLLSGSWARWAWLWLPGQHRGKSTWIKRGLVPILAPSLTRLELDKITSLNLHFLPHKGVVGRGNETHQWPHAGHPAFSHLCLAPGSLLASCLL